MERRPATVSPQQPFNPMRGTSKWVSRAFHRRDGVPGTIAGGWAADETPLRKTPPGDVRTAPTHSGHHRRSDHERAGEPGSLGYAQRPRAQSRVGPVFLSGARRHATGGRLSRRNVSPAVSFGSSEDKGRRCRAPRLAAMAGGPVSPRSRRSLGWCNSQTISFLSTEERLQRCCGIEVFERDNRALEPVVATTCVAVATAAADRRPRQS